MTLARALIEARYSLGLSLRALEKATGIPRATLSQHERGKQWPSLESLCKLAVVFGWFADDAPHRGFDYKGGHVEIMPRWGSFTPCVKYVHPVPNGLLESRFLWIKPLPEIR